MQDIGSDDPSLSGALISCQSLFESSSQSQFDWDQMIQDVTGEENQGDQGDNKT